MYPGTTTVKIRVLEKRCIKVNSIPEIEYAKASSKLNPALIGYDKVVIPSYQRAQKKPNIPEIGTRAFLFRLNKMILPKPPAVPIILIAII